MLKIICQKQFTQSGDYTKKDIEIFNDCIQAGIKELKMDWRDPESEGIELIETESELCFELDERKIDFENMYDSMERIERDIMAVVNNYAIPFTIDR